LTHLCLVLITHKTDPVAIVHLIGNARLQVLAFRVHERHLEVENFFARNNLVDCRIVLLPNEYPHWSLARRHVCVAISTG
jgi:hypothetical protein